MSNIQNLSTFSFGLIFEIIYNFQSFTNNSITENNTFYLSLCNNSKPED